MKYDAIKKNGEQWVRIRPALQIYNDSGVLTDTVEDAWFLCEITPDSATLRSRDTQHAKVIGLDHIHNYMEDPEGQRTMGTTGTLVMNVQFLLHEGVLLTEPVAPPGNSLKAFVRARPRASLLNAAANLHRANQLKAARKAYAWSPEGVQAARAAFAEIPQECEAFRAELAAAGHPIDMVLRQLPGGAHMLGVAGWWITFWWQNLAANTIEEARLVVTHWDGVPKLPGLMVFDEGGHNCGADHYTFGLAALDQPRWMAAANVEVSFTTKELVQDLLTRLLNDPNPNVR